MLSLCVALAAGSIVSLGLTLVGLGVRPDLITARALIFLVVKLFFAVGIVSLALVYLTRLARPGGGAKNLGGFGRNTIRGYRGTFRHQPWVRAQLPLGQDDRGRSVANAFSRFRSSRSYPSLLRSGPCEKLRLQILLVQELSPVSLQAA